MTMPTLPDAHDCVVNNPTFIEFSHAQIHLNKSGSKRKGLQTLLKESIPEASHDSAVRYPPPKCHPGTRRDYIEKLTSWAINADNHPDRIVWLNGPAGVGKSAIAQSCAEALGEKLGAAFFFSRPNNRDDPNRFFTSLSYQLAVKFGPYGDLLDSEIRRDPILVKKSMPHQFHDLFVTPFQELRARGEKPAERVIIVDGLDECAVTEAQVDIVKIVAESARAKSTPFLWIFLSRLEPHLVAVFNSLEVKDLSQQIELRITREIDGEIAVYLTDKLAEIARKRDLRMPWPTEDDIWVLVSLSAGLFVYSYTIIRFIDEEDSTGPIDQLRAVLSLANCPIKSGPNHPLSGLNHFYTLIMTRIPSKKLRTLQLILLATRMPRIWNAVDNANLLGLSEDQFRHACRSLHSVMTINNNSVKGIPSIEFYHASFMDFLEDPARSGGFCIWSDCAVALWDDVLRRLDQIRVTCDSNGDHIPDITPTWLIDDHPPAWKRYGDLVGAFFKLLGSINFDIDTQRLNALINLDLRKVSFQSTLVTGMQVQALLGKIPSRVRLTRPSTFKKLLRFAQYVSSNPPRKPVYVIGHGAKKTLLTEGQYTNDLLVVPYSKRAVKEYMRRVYKESQKVTTG